MGSRRRWVAGILIALVWTARLASATDLKADFDGDGVVDLDDFFLFSERFGKASGDPDYDARFDLVGDGKINLADFFLFAQSFGTRSDEPAPTGPRRTFLYVADSPDNGVSVLETETNLVLTYIPSRGPSGLSISPDQRTTYIVDYYTFLVLRDDFSVEYTLPLSGGAKMALSPDGRRAFVTQESADNVLFVDLDRKAASDTVKAGRAPFGIAIHPDGRSLYVVNSRSASAAVSAIDIPGRRVRDSLRVATSPGMMVVSPDGRRGYLNSASEGTITIVSLSPLAVAGSLQTGGAAVYGLALSRDGRRLYATSTGRVIVVDTERNLILDRIAVADDTGPLAVSPDGGRLYVSGYSAAGGGTAVYILDLAARKILGKLRGFSFPTDIAFRTSSTDVPPSRRIKPTVPEVGVAWERRGAWRPEPPEQ